MMSPLNALIFGLGLFFLGMRLVGDNLKGLCSGGFRAAIATTTRHRTLRGALGLSAGALMQSATAVTFICVSMVSAGLLKFSAAGVVIIWSNVGLTALAFVATLNIHPYVAFFVGGSGIVMGVVRVRSWQTVASVMLGMGLILLGLEQMGEGAAPLGNEEWFRHAMSLAMGTPLLTFLAGVLIAAILQSNTGATMMVITLAGAGAIDLKNAALLIYGTNLGAIGLRLILASGLKGESLRLVRLEDLFCVVSGGVMFLLYCVEQAGVPLVFAASDVLAHGIPARLAVIFLLSNLIPAILMMLVLPLCAKLLAVLWPDARMAASAGTPQFLQATALHDPATALDLLRKELARLAGMIHGEESRGPDGDSAPSADFQSLSLAIEDFATKLASRNALNESTTQRLHKLRAVLSAIRHVEDGERSFANRLRTNPEALSPEVASVLNHSIRHLMDSAAAAIDSNAEAFHELVRRHGPFLENLRKLAFPESGSAPIARTALSEDFEIVAWTLHRLAKVLGFG